jgi:hypothetical protein
MLDPITKITYKVRKAARMKFIALWDVTFMLFSFRLPTFQKLSYHRRHSIEPDPVYRPCTFAVYTVSHNTS